MALKKRSKVDVSILGENLPLNNIKLYEQSNHNLHKSLDQYRKENESLNRNNILLSRKNDILEQTLSSVSSLWDSLNTDVDLFLSQQLADGTSDVSNNKEVLKGMDGSSLSPFWKKLANNKFPFISPTDSDDDVDFDELSYMFENDEFMLPDNYIDESEWEKHKESFLKSKVEFFQSKKDFLVKSLSTNHPNYVFDTTGLVNVLKYNCLHYSKLFYYVYNAYKKLKNSNNSSKIEISRLNKQIAFLKFELKSNPAYDSKKDSDSSSSSSDSDGEPVKPVENVEEVTEDMVLGSSLYSRLFNYAKNMDKEISRLESENLELRNKVASLSESPCNELFELKSNFDTITNEMTEKLESFEKEFVENAKELATLRESYNIVSDELEQYKLERKNLADEMNRMELKISKLLSQNASMCKSLCTDTSPLENSNISENSEKLDSTDTKQNPDLEFYKEQLLNISEELEEVSSAFEKKQKMCDELMRQISDTSETKKKLLKMEDSYNSLMDRFNKLVSSTSNKVSNHEKQCELLQKMVEDYKHSWALAFKRGTFLQHQRDVAVSAVCEIQAQYRKSCRSQKALQDYLTLIRTGVVRTSSVDSNLGDVHNVIAQENSILRRRMICTVCSENFKDHVITKCGHVFCHSCLTNNIKSRNRKCPQCKITFDKNDTQKIFLD